MTFETRLSPDFIPTSATSAAALHAASSPASRQPLPIGNGSFSDGVAGTSPQRDLDLQLAEMANDAYDVSGPDGTTGTQSAKDLAAAGWTRLQPEGDHLVDANGNEIAIDPASLEDKSTGFRAAIYQNAQGQYVVAYAGTNPKEMGDIKADATQAFGMDTKQYNQAIALAKEAEVAFGDGNVAFTGHSLGGGLASAAALSVDASAVTFNAAGLSNETLRNLGLNPNAARDQVADSGQVRRYVVNGDPLTLAQQDAPVLPIPFAPPLSPPNAVGHELRIQAPAGTTPIIGAHGGSGDGTTYVEALKQNTPYEPARPLDGTAAGLALETLQNFGELNFNTLGSAIDAVTGFVGDTVNVVKDTAGQIKDVVSTDYANGDYVEGTVSIAADVVDGGLDIVGDAASGAVSLAGDGVQNVADFGGSVIRDLGDLTGLQAPANAVAGFVEGAGAKVSDWADAAGNGIEWGLDKLGDGAEWAMDKLGDGAQWVTDKAVDGAQWLGGKTVEGAQWVGGKIVDGAVAVKDGVVAGGKAIADGAAWVGDKINKAMPWNW
ncbi:MAG TPA: lipase family protein [Luteimonas sp.]|nr:lipase family protein [Luteimonas sp.]